MKRIVNWRQQIESRFLGLIDPICAWLNGLRVSPNAVSVTGLIISITAGLWYGAGQFFLGGIGVFLSGACDAIDGRLARRAGRESPFGAFLDSTLDRIGEIAVFSGLAVFFSSGADGGNGSGSGMVLLCILALTGSLMVSYARARAEGLSAACAVGLMQRPERMFLLIVGSLGASLPVIGIAVMQLTVGALAFLTWFSVLQRGYHVYRQLARQKDTRPD